VQVVSGGERAGAGAQPTLMRFTLASCGVRPWTAADEPALLRHANNPRIAMHLRDRFPHPYEAEHARKFLQWVIQQPLETVWAIEVGGEAAGGIGIELHADVERVSAEIGYWLGEAHWGRGIVSAVLQAVSPEVLERFDLTRLYALPFADNAASVRVLEKAGFVLEGRLHRSAIKHGQIKDQLLYARYR
jgi:RimJ/RimL family protein N-acetyltransferase